MNVINTGGMYRLFGDGLETYNELPVQFYLVRFDKNSGFFLTRHDDIEIAEKVYGIHDEKVSKVISAFRGFDRNLGVILSGAKGIGKSMFAKLLAIRAIKEEIPVVIVDSYYPGIANYIASIQQEVLVMFDEFDKTFYKPGSSDSMNDPQSEMLTLFDGLSQGKKLFVVTCNEIRNLNSYIVNRPGRFHYHFRFEYPTPVEIMEYMKDKLPESTHPEIEKVINFSRKVDLNYDCLRAIAFELSDGSPFEKVITDLNILHLNDEDYIFSLRFSDGTADKFTHRVDMFSGDDVGIECYDNHGYEYDIVFNPCHIIHDAVRNVMMVDPETVHIDWNVEYYSRRSEEEKAKANERAKRKLVAMEISRRMDRKLHYAV